MKRWDPDRVIRQIKVLGIMWGLVEDQLSLRIDWEASYEDFTPRRLMKLIGTIFDPLGFV